MCQGIRLVPLMCGATNVTMSSDQLAEVIIAVPNVLLQDEVIESALIGLNAAAMARQRLHFETHPRIKTLSSWQKK